MKTPIAAKQTDTIVPVMILWAFLWFTLNVRFKDMVNRIIYIKWSIIKLLELMIEMSINTWFFLNLNHRSAKGLTEGILGLVAIEQDKYDPKKTY